MEAPRTCLVIDGLDVTDECTAVEISMPTLVYKVPDDGPWVSRVLGPRGFTILITSPSAALLALVDGGASVHTVQYIAANGYSVTHLVQFHKQWVGADGVPKMFGCLASNRDNEAKWVKEAQLADA